jgi:hypothetical protein
MLFACAIPALATPPAPDPSYSAPEVVLFLGYLNFDCVPDTVVGIADENLQYIPRYILWGTWDSLAANPCVPSDTSYHRPKFDTTYIDYPAWRNLGVTLATISYNVDTLTDLVFHIRGQDGDTLAPHDTVRAIAIFGQRALDTLASIAPAGIGGFLQTVPYFAIEMRIGSQLVQPDTRDLSGRESFVMATSTVSVMGGGSPGPYIADIENESSAAVRIYPNPATNTTKLEAKPIAPGQYDVEVIAVNGQVERRQKISVDQSGELLRILDLSSLPNGYYVLRLLSSQKLVGTYPILITR